MNARMCVRHAEVHCIRGTGVSEDSGLWGSGTGPLQHQGLTVEWYFEIGHDLGLRLNCTKRCYSRVSDLRNAVSWGSVLAGVCGAPRAVRCVQGCLSLP